MKKFSQLLFVIVLFLQVKSLAANEVSARLSLEGTYFINEGLYEEQKRKGFSLALEPEYFHQFESGSSFTFVPFGRYDSIDKNRTHYDIREFNYHLVSKYFELKLGVSKVFWGATEFVHLVDIINQTDLIESVDGEDKLGQPMVNFSMPTDYGNIDLFVLPYFRERIFPGEKGRFRAPLIIKKEDSQYESNREERHIDFAARYSHTLSIFDFGLSYFRGTNREPHIVMRGAKAVPYYEQISQTSFDLQGVVGELLVKFESLYRTSKYSENYYALTGGLEYTLVSLFGSKSDLGVIIEYAYDDRKEASTSSFQNDLMLGLRFTLNDQASSELLAGVVHDLEYHSRALSLEASRRFGDKLKASLEGRYFWNTARDDLTYHIREDDFIRMELMYYL